MDGRRPWFRFASQIQREPSPPPPPPQQPTATTSPAPPPPRPMLTRLPSLFAPAVTVPASPLPQQPRREPEGPVRAPSPPPSVAQSDAVQPPRETMSPAPPPPRPALTRLPSLFAPAVVPASPPPQQPRREPDGPVSAPPPPPPVAQIEAILTPRGTPRGEAAVASERRPPPSPRREYPASVPPSPRKPSPTPLGPPVAEVIKGSPRVTPQPSPRASLLSEPEFKRPAVDFTQPPPLPPPSPSKPEPETLHAGRDFLREYRNGKPLEQRRAPSPSPSPSPSPVSPPKIFREPELMPPPIETKTVLLRDLTDGREEKKLFPPLSSPLPPAESTTRATKPLEPMRKKKPVGEEEAAKAGTAAMSMLTIAGENTGAHMELGGLRRQVVNNRNGSAGAGRGKPGEPFNGRFYHNANNSSSSTRQAQNGNNGLTVEENNKARTAAGSSARPPTAAVVNSNVQGVNNSILFRSTCTTGSPGVYVTLSSSSKGARRPSAVAIPASRNNGGGGGKYQ